ncbi:MAG: hypothetical protein Q4E12_07690 [Coriobacteriia bacterium]|nr:hypothetical protein [Coriobacteriia bacterium]
MSEIKEETEILEIDEDRIVGYLMDEDDNEVGLIYTDDEGNEVELYYDEDFYAEEPEEDVLELEIDEDAILYYLYDRDREEVGLIVLDENGQEQRFLYAPEPQPELAPAPAAAPAAPQAKSDEVTKDDMRDMFEAFKDVAKSGYEALSGVMDQVDDVRDQLDEVNPKKRREQRRMEKAAQRQAEMAVEAQARAEAAKQAAEAAAAASEGAAGV